MNKNPKTSDEYYHITRVGSYPLTDFYESKPETAYDELCSIHNDIIDSCGDVRQEIKDLYIFLDKYESQLKELK